MKTLKARLFKWLTGVSLVELENIQRSTPTPSSDELSDNYLFDFLNYSAPRSDTGQMMLTESRPGSESLKIKVKPIDVLNELEVPPVQFALLGIDEKISMLEDKREIINQTWAKREVEGLIERLENRKKYEGKTADFFNRLQNTTDEKIEDLIQKYELVLSPADLFIPELPEQAIKIMKSYTLQVEKICKKKPVFYVVATSKNFKTVDKKRDPILLVQSPFGFFWQILGAWDKEMLILSEL